MKTREIPRGDWRTFSDEFSAAHEGWRATLAVMSPSIGSQQQIVNLPLLGVTTEKDIIHVSAGATPDQITHSIHDVSHVRVEERNGEIAVQIESGDDTTAILVCRPAVSTALTAEMPQTMTTRTAP